MEWIDNLLDGTTGGSLTFLVLALVGVVLLLISVILGGIFDIFDAGDGPLSLTTIAAFMAVFGFVGYASVGAGISVPIAAIIGVLSGGVGGILAWFMARFFQNSESSASFEINSLVDTEAYVILRIPGGDGFGEIALARQGQRQTFSAIAKEPIITGSKVKILATITNSSVLVEEIKNEAKNENDDTVITS